MKICHKELRETHICLRIIEKRKHAFAILRNPRLLKHHVLIIPNRHVENISELNSEEVNEKVKNP